MATTEASDLLVVAAGSHDDWIVLAYTAISPKEIHHARGGLRATDPGTTFRADRPLGVRAAQRPTAPTLPDPPAGRRRADRRADRRRDGGQSLDRGTPPHAARPRGP